jgi:hypothetical protein
MAVQNRVNVLKFPVFGLSGDYIDASTLAEAEYVIFDCYGSVALRKTLSNGGLYVATVANGDKILETTLTANESRFSGQVRHGLKVALVPGEYLGVTLDFSKISFIETEF